MQEVEKVFVQHEKVLELERSQRQRGYDGPTIG